MARPSSYTTEIAEKIAERLANGEPLARICADPEMPGYSTARRWEAENEEFRAISARAKDWGHDFLADDCVRISDDPTIDAQDKRIRVDTRLRLLGMWSRRYNPKLDLNHGGQPGNPISMLLSEVSGQAIHPVSDDPE